VVSDVVVFVTFPRCFLVLVVDLTVSLETLPFESEAVFVVVESVLIVLPLSLVSVAVDEVDSVVDCSVFWAIRATAVKSEANKSVFMSFISYHGARTSPATMNIDVDDDELKPIIDILDHIFAYTRGPRVETLDIIGSRMG
jgi:hypothetical protein